MPDDTLPLVATLCLLLGEVQEEEGDNDLCVLPFVSGSIASSYMFPEVVNYMYVKETFTFVKIIYYFYKKKHLPSPVSCQIKVSIWRLYCNRNP